MTLKRVFRYDSSNRLLRLFRVIWDGPELSRGGWPVSKKLSVGLRPTLFRWRREDDGWLLTVLGLRVRYRVSHGGRFA